jgi:exosortase D (VPLPA-CTERM-specific)
MNRLSNPYKLPPTAGSIAILGLAFLFLYHQTLSGLWSIWSTDGDYSFALAIPFVSGYLIWTRRSRLSAAPLRPSPAGGFCLVLLLLISLYGILGSSPSAVRPALPLMMLAVTLFCFGWTHFRLLIFPFSLLLFMIPLPTLVQTHAGVLLRRLSTLLGEGLLRVTGVSVFVEGNIIDLGTTQLQVVDACSGLRYVLPLLALGVLFGYFFEPSRWRRFLLAVSTLPISILCNSIRIAMTGYLAQNRGASIAAGFYHGFSGWLMFVFALSLLFGVFHLMRFLRPTEAGGGDLSAPVASVPPSRPGRHRAAVATASVMLLGAGLLGGATAGLPPVQLAGGFFMFPLELKNWQGRTAPLDSRIIVLSGAEEALNAAYVSDTGDTVSLFIGYRSSPFVESENFFHSPNVCLPSLGWRTAAISDHVLTAVPGFGEITVRKMVIEKTGIRQLVYYWFQTRDRVSADVNVNRFHLTLHALLHDATHDLFIRPITPLKPGESVASAEKRLDEFVRLMMAGLLPFLEKNQVTGSN